MVLQFQNWIAQDNSDLALTFNWLKEAANAFEGFEAKYLEIGSAVFQVAEGIIPSIAAFHGITEDVVKDTLAYNRLKEVDRLFTEHDRWVMLNLRKVSAIKTLSEAVAIINHLIADRLGSNATSAPGGAPKAIVVGTGKPYTNSIPDSEAGNINSNCGAAGNEKESGAKPGFQLDGAETEFGAETQPEDDMRAQSGDGTGRGSVDELDDIDDMDQGSENGNGNSRRKRTSPARGVNFSGGMNVENVETWVKIVNSIVGPVDPNQSGTGKEQGQKDNNKGKKGNEVPNKKGNIESNPGLQRNKGHVTSTSKVWHHIDKRPRVTKEIQFKGSTEDEQLNEITNGSDEEDDIESMGSGHMYQNTISSKASRKSRVVKEIKEKMVLLSAGKCSSTPKVEARPNFILISKYEVEGENETGILKEGTNPNNMVVYIDLTEDDGEEVVDISNEITAQKFPLLKEEELFTVSKIAAMFTGRPRKEVLEQLVVLYKVLDMDKFLKVIPRVGEELDKDWDREMEEDTSLEEDTDGD
ncbi:hypothetical protein DFH27DRAFT_615995 [Peziza echinospora]|nr:hypothetical protein DFH27DRAFT_615995 [Peziza echinospora]